MKEAALVVDACILITFGNASALDLITGIQRYRVATSARVVVEVSQPPARDEVEAAIRAGSLPIEAIDLSNDREQSALQRFDSRPAFKNRADAEVLALAVCRDWILCSDEITLRRTATSEIGIDRIAGSLDILIWAVAERRLDQKEAEEFLPRLDIGPRLLARLDADGLSFSDLLAH